MDACIVKEFFPNFLPRCERLIVKLLYFTRNGFLVDLITANRPDKIISITDCKRILNRNGNNFTDDEIQQIRDFLIVLAEVQHSHFKSKENEKSDIIYKSINR